MSKAATSCRKTKNGKVLSAADAEAWSAGVEDLAALARAAKSRGLKLLVDAETSDKQPAVRLLARELMAEANVGSATVGAFPELFIHHLK